MSEGLTPHYKPCPFCGNTLYLEIVHTISSEITFKVMCSMCKARGPESSEEIGALTLWNSTRYTRGETMKLIP